MKKALYLLMISMLAGACSSPFSKQKYTSFHSRIPDSKYRPKQESQEKQPDYRFDISSFILESEKEFTTKPVEKDSAVIATSLNSIDLINQKTEVQKEILVLKTAPVSNKLYPNNGVANENVIRQKGNRSIFVGIAALLIVAVGFYFIVQINMIFLAFIIAGGLLSFLGLQLGIAAKRDMDQISDRSSKKKMNRTATIGFILNLIALVASGLVLFMLLLTLL